MRVLLMHGLGICEHCNSPFTAQDIKGGSVGWHCPACGWVITDKSFGYEYRRDALKKVRWVGKHGRWTPEKPKSNFHLVIKREKCFIITWLDKNFGRPGGYNTSCFWM